MAKSTNEVDQNLKQVLADIEKQFGKGSLMRLGDNDRREIDVISSGSIALDVALGIGGYPKGRIIEIFGPESSGKTTFALHAIAEAQKAGGKVAFIDAENSLDPQYAARLGVDINELLLSQPDNGEQALEITEALVRSGAISVIVISPVAGSTSERYAFSIISLFRKCSVICSISFNLSISITLSLIAFM